MLDLLDVPPMQIENAYALARLPRNGAAFRGVKLLRARGDAGLKERRA